MEIVFPLKVIIHPPTSEQFTQKSKTDVFGVRLFGSGYNTKQVWQRYELERQHLCGVTGASIAYALPSSDLLCGWHKLLLTH